VKKVLVLLLAVLALATPVIATYDIFDYSGPADNYSGAPEYIQIDGDDDATETDGSGLVYITTNVYYDMREEMFSYELKDMGASILCSAMDGMVTADPVSIILPDGVDAELYCDGVLVEEADFEMITEPGSYTLNRIVSGNRTRVMAFNIVGELVSSLMNYRLPTGFSVDSVKLDNVEVASDSNLVDLYEEGDYAIKYTCMMTNVDYALYIKVDHTPPVLELAAVKNGVASGPVDISDLEPGASIRIELDGTRIAPSDVLKQSGYYNLHVYDEAGNVTDYSFRIKVYFNTNSYVFMILFVAVVVAIIVFMRKSRKNMRVR